MDSRAACASSSCPSVLSGLDQCWDLLVDGAVKLLAGRVHLLHVRGVFFFLT